MKHHKKKYLIVLGLIGLVTLWYFIHKIYNKFQVTTNNAYVSVETVTINSKLNQKIKHVYTKNEQHVTSGEILLELEDQEYIEHITAIKASLFLAEQQLQIATTNHQQASSLFAAKRIPKKEYDLASKELTAAIKKHSDCQKLLNTAEENLQHTKFHASSNGWITNMKLNHSQEVQQNHPVFELVKDTKFEIIANLSKKQAKYVRLYQKAKIQIKEKNMEDYQFLGEVQEINNINKTTYKVKILITNNDFKLPLRNGMKAKVTIYTTPFIKPITNSLSFS